MASRIRTHAAAALLGILSLGAIDCSSDSSSGDAPGAVDSAAVARGAAAVKTRDCASCHAAADKSLSGSTTPRPGTRAYAPNITPDEATGVGGWTPAQLTAAILNGVDDENAMLCAIMPRFKSAGMTESEAQDIAAYLKSLAPVTHEIPESACAEKP